MKNRNRDVEAAGFALCCGQIVAAGERVDVAGPRLTVRMAMTFSSRSMAFVVSPESWYAVARLFIIVKTSGWSGLSFALLRRRDSSSRGSSFVGLPDELIASGEVIDRGQRGLGRRARAWRGKA